LKNPDYFITFKITCERPEIQDVNAFSSIFSKKRYSFFKLKHKKNKSGTLLTNCQLLYFILFISIFKLEYISNLVIKSLNRKVK
jgi:hypothetical protein